MTCTACGGAVERCLVPTHLHHVEVPAVPHFPEVTS